MHSNPHSTRHVPCLVAHASPWKAKALTQSREKVYNFKAHYRLPLPNGMVAHTLMYWPIAGAFGPSVLQPLNLNSLRKLQ